MIENTAQMLRAFDFLSEPHTAREVSVHLGIDRAGFAGFEPGYYTCKYFARKGYAVAIEQTKPIQYQIVDSDASRAYRALLVSINHATLAHRRIFS